MKRLTKSLLPKKFKERGALNLGFLKIKPGFAQDLLGLRRLTNIYSKFALILISVLFLLTLQPVAGFPPVKQTITQAAEEQTDQVSSAVMPELQLPHPGYLSSKFSRFHPGVDIATGLGMPINPIADGTVESASLGFFGYGNHVIIKHDSGLKSLYAHMARIYVKQNQVVNKKDSLGTVGLTGFTSGPHTHLEVTKDGNYVDPLTILPAIQDYPSEQFLKPVEVKPETHKQLKPDFT